MIININRQRSSLTFRRAFGILCWCSWCSLTKMRQDSLSSLERNHQPKSVNPLLQYHHPFLQQHHFESYPYTFWIEIWWYSNSFAYPSVSYKIETRRPESITRGIPYLWEKLCGHKLTLSSDWSQLSLFSHFLLFLVTQMLISLFLISQCIFQTLPDKLDIELVSPNWFKKSDFIFRLKDWTQYSDTWW